MKITEYRKCYVDLSVKSEYYIDRGKGSNLDIIYEIKGKFWRDYFIGGRGWSHWSHGKLETSNWMRQMYEALTEEEVFLELL